MLEKVNFDEARQSQLPFVEMLINMGYKYISVEDAFRQRGNDNSNFILREIAVRKLMEINDYEIDGEKFKFSEKDVRDAIDELENIQYEGLIDTSQKIYNMIMPTSGGKTITINHGGKKLSQNFRYIDFEYTEKNDFHVTVEFVASGKQNIRPDVVCFVNGIPFVISENKKSSIDIKEAINQMNRNQGPEFCPRLFTYTQLLVGTNCKEIKYGTTGTQNKFYAIWKEKGLNNEKPGEIGARSIVPLLNDKAKLLINKEINSDVYSQVLNDLNCFINSHKQRTDRLPTVQDRALICFFEPGRLLDLAKNYILYDGGEKKISRYQQYFAIRKMLIRISEIENTESGIRRRRGGLLWHTQGSGKSLTMVMFVKALIENPKIINPRVIIVTDRRDLDKQIKNTFINCNLKKNVIQATSGQHLIDLIKENNLSVITTLVDKFESARKKYIDFVDKDENIFVLVDEAHRSHSGIANLEMNRIIPNACYIGFTGTPLMTKEKESWKKFGGYIDRYTIDDALEDKIIVPLIYEGRYVIMEQNAEQIDRHELRVSEGMAERQKSELHRFISTKIIKNNPQRINEIAYDIEKHFIEKFQGTGLKAQIVAPSKYSAVLFQEYFEKSGKITTAVIISDEHDDGDEEDAHKNKVKDYLFSVRMKHASVEKYEKEVIESFKYNEDGIEIIIVVDKLLTGFDAPRNTVLYLAKDLHDHGLLQAIARVNRLYENKKLPKTAGYIIDYSENAKNLKTAMKLFGNYEDDDVKGTLIDIAEKIEALEQCYSRVNDIFKEISSSKDDEAFLQLLGDEPKRETFYKELNDFIRTLNECFILQDFVHEFKHLDLYIRDLKKLMELRKAATLKYADSIDLSEYKQSLIKILDRYVDAKGVELLTKQINITDKKLFDEAVDNLGTDKSKAEAIAAQTQKTIAENWVKDPEYYARFSEKISKILEEMRQKRIADIEALKQLKLISDDVVNKKDEELPKKISENKGSDIFYRNLYLEFENKKVTEDIYTEIIIELFNIVKKEAIVDWYKNSDIKREIMNVLDDYLYDKVKNNKGVEFSNEELKNLISRIMTLAENNYEIFNAI